MRDRMLVRCVMHTLRVACPVLALGCTRPPNVVRSAPRPNDAPLIEREQLPYAPPSAPRGSTGDGVAIAVTGGEEQGRTIALAMVEALLEGDAASLQALFAERIVYVLEGVERSSAEPIARCMQEARSLAYEPGLRTSSVVSPQAIAVRRADAYHAHVPMPPGISPNDWVVTLPPTDSSNETSRRVLCLHTLYVRPGPHSLIVGVAR